MAGALQEAGYATGLFGKWGLGELDTVGHPLQQGFDDFYGYLNQRHAHNCYPEFIIDGNRKVPLRNRYDPAWIKMRETQGRSGAGMGSTEQAGLQSPTSSPRRRATSIGWSRSGKPFLLLFTTTLPHANNEAGTNGMEIPNPGPYADTDWPPAQKAHAAMIDRLDRDVGRILDLVDSLGLRERTLVLFSSDNGPHREGGNNPDFNHSSGPLRGIKRDLYEGGIRVPFLARWPGRIPAGKTSDVVGWFPDFFPTAARLAGAPIPPGLDGVDLTPVLLGGENPPGRAPLYWEFHEGGFKQAVRDGDWKAVRRGPSLPLELYDVRVDPGESNDIAAAHPAEVARLTGLLSSLRVDSPDWPMPPKR